MSQQESEPAPAYPGVSVGIACRLDKQSAFNLARDVTNFLLKLKCKVYLENRIASKMGFFHFGISLNQMSSEKVKFIISIGGDGTILRVFQNLPETNPAPVLGVNVGSLGFLDETAKYDVKRAIKEILNDNYQISQSLRLATYYDGKRYPDALNEVLVCSSRPSKVIMASILVDGAVYASGYADGVMVATPTGSTAYSLSAGGALIDPRAQDIFQIIPLNPFGANNMHPIIVPSTATVEVALQRPRLPATLVIDGQLEVKVNPTARIQVKASDRWANFITFEDRGSSFYKRLNKILLPTQTNLPKNDYPEDIETKNSKN
ncbi:MAG TPA: NAD(+)/NADH kinase [Candidatus Lokiarchaeia archaeon]|nr:NAD(+)/NADH kinase [Candidatus Lokiarchaeia archaeon]